MWGTPKRYIINGPHGERIAPEDSGEDIKLKEILRQEIEGQRLHEMEVAELEALIKSEEEKLDPQYLNEGEYRRLYHRVELLHELLHELKKESKASRKARKFLSSLAEKLRSLIS